MTVDCIIVTHLTKEVVSSAAEAETGGLFYNGKEACPIRTTLSELGFPQGPTPIQTDNSTACGIANDTVKQRRSKAMDMRYYWIRDRVIQNQFHIYWSKGSDNLADYFTKHHPASHHRALRPFYLHTANALFSSCEGVLITSSGIQELYELELEPSSPISPQPSDLSKLITDARPPKL